MWILPSLDRPASLERFFAAYRATAGTTPGLVVVDLADWARHEARYEAIELPPGWLWQITEAVSQGDKIREIWPAIEGCAWLGLIGDDCIPETACWDQLLLGQLDRVGMVSCDDAWQAAPDVNVGRVGNCWVMSGELVRAAGYIFPAGLQHLFVDDLWERIGREAGCWRVRMDVTVRHAHVLKGEASPDDTHRRVYGAGFVGGLWPSDEAAYLAWLEKDAQRVIAAVRAARSESQKLTVAADAVAPDNSEAALARRLARARSRSVMLLVPSARCPVFEFTIAYGDTRAMLAELGIRNESRFVRFSSNLPRARNELAARFLAAGYDDAILADDDMGWEANAIIRMLASAQPIVAAVGRKKVDKPLSDPDIWCCAMPDGPCHQDDMGNVRVPRVGTGLMKVAREVFLALEAAHPEWKRDAPAHWPREVRDHYYQFFRFGDDDTSEDFLFCDHWRETGGEVWIDPTIALSHTGEKVYRGRIADVMQAAA